MASRSVDGYVPGYVPTWYLGYGPTPGLVELSQSETLLQLYLNDIPSTLSVTNEQHDKPLS